MKTPLPTNTGGSTLLEVVVALAVFSIVTAAGVGQASAALAALGRAYSHEEAVRSADHLMNAVSLWTRGDFEGRMGRRSQGGMYMVVRRAAPNLFEVVLTDTASGAILVESAVLRLPEQ